MKSQLRYDHCSCGMVGVGQSIGKDGKCRGAQSADSSGHPEGDEWPARVTRKFRQLGESRNCVAAKELKTVDRQRTIGVFIGKAWPAPKDVSRYETEQRRQQRRGVLLDPFEQLRNGVRAHGLQRSTVGCTSLEVERLPVFGVFDEPFMKASSLVRWLAFPGAEGDGYEYRREATQGDEGVSSLPHEWIVQPRWPVFNSQLRVP